MKKPLIFALATALIATTASFADIQSPPGDKHNRVRKLGRGIGNIVYGINEIPYNWRRSVEEEGTIYAGSIGLVRGGYRTLVRAGFGVYEFVTFPFKTYKGGFMPPYGERNIWWDLNHGYHELAPEMGFQTRFDYGRSVFW